MSGTFPGQLPTKSSHAHPGSPTNASVHPRTRNPTSPPGHPHFPTQSFKPSPRCRVLRARSAAVAKQDALTTSTSQEQLYLDPDGLLDHVSRILQEHRSQTTSEKLEARSTAARDAYDAGISCLRVVQSMVIELTDRLYLHHTPERPSRNVSRTEKNSQPKRTPQEAYTEDRIKGLIRWAHRTREFAVEDFLHEVKNLNGTLEPLLQEQGTETSKPPSKGVSDEEWLADEARLGFGAMLLGLVVSKGHVLELGWLLSELHTITRFASAATACLEVAKTECEDYDQARKVDSTTSNLFLFWSEFCLSIFELLRGALEVWVPLRITPHNCPALCGVGVSGSQRKNTKPGSGSTVPAVIDIPSQAIKLGARLARMSNSWTSSRRATLALLEANRTRLNWVHVVEARGVDHGSSASSGDILDTESSGSDDDDAGGVSSKPSGRVPNSQAGTQPGNMCKAWAKDPITATPEIADVFIASPDRRGSGPACNKTWGADPQPPVPVGDFTSEKSDEPFVPASVLSAQVVKHVYAKKLGSEMLRVLPCLRSFVHPSVDLGHRLARAGHDSKLAASSEGLKPRAKGLQASGKHVDLTHSSIDVLLGLYDFDGFIRRCKKSKEPIDMWEVQYSEPWVQGLQMRSFMDAGRSKMPMPNPCSKEETAQVLQDCINSTDKICRLLSAWNGDRNAGHTQLATSTVTALKRTLSSIESTGNGCEKTAQVSIVVRAINRELRPMMDTCVLMHGSWDETHLWRGTAVAENLQWSCARLAVLTTVLVSSAAGNRNVQFRLPHSALEPGFAAHLHAAAAAFRATHPDTDPGELAAWVHAFLAVPRVVLPCEQERTVLATCSRLLAQLALDKSNKWGDMDALKSVKELLAAKVPADWKRSVAKRVQTLCQERSWLLLQAERDPAVLRAALRPAAPGDATAAAAAPADRRVQRWMRALKEEQALADVLGGSALAPACPVLCVRYHARGKMAPVSVPGCDCVMSWLAGTLAVKDGRCLLERCQGKVPSGSLKEVSMADAAAAAAAAPARGQKRQFSDTLTDLSAEVYHEEYLSPFSCPKSINTILESFVASIPSYTPPQLPPSVSMTLPSAELGIRLRALRVDTPAYMPASLKYLSDLFCAEQLHIAAQEAASPSGSLKGDGGAQTPMPECVRPESKLVQLPGSGQYPTPPTASPRPPIITGSEAAFAPVSPATTFGSAGETVLVSAGLEDAARQDVLAGVEAFRSSLGALAGMRPGENGGRPQVRQGTGHWDWFGQLDPAVLLGLQVISYATDPGFQPPVV